MSNVRDLPRDLRCGSVAAFCVGLFLDAQRHAFAMGRQSEVTLPHTCSAVAVVCFHSTNNQVVNVFGWLTFRSIRDRLPT